MILQPTLSFQSQLRQRAMSRTLVFLLCLWSRSGHWHPNHSSPSPIEVGKATFLPQAVQSTCIKADIEQAGDQRVKVKDGSLHNVCPRRCSQFTGMLGAGITLGGLPLRQHYTLKKIQHKHEETASLFTPSNRAKIMIAVSKSVMNIPQNL